MIRASQLLAPILASILASLAETMNWRYLHLVTHLSTLHKGYPLLRASTIDIGAIPSPVSLHALRRDLQVVGL